MYTVRPVAHTKELDRILALPERRALEEGNGRKLTMSRRLNPRYYHKYQLRPLQAQALFELVKFHGLFVPLAVGEGKTLITYLIPTVVDPLKCVLVVAAKHFDKTLNEFAEYKEQGWKGIKQEIITYEQISTKTDLLNKLNPEVLVCDECHKLANPKAAVTRRIRRWFVDHLETWFVCLSGTITKRSFTDWHHLVQWSLPAVLQPLPIRWYDMKEWALALDEKNWLMSRSLGALKVFGKDKTTARIGYGKRLAATPGVILSEVKPVAEIPLTIKIKKLNIPDINEIHNYVLENWELPTGIEFCDALELHRHLKEISQGCFYEWVKQPPNEWRLKRRAYNSFVREKIRRSRTYDTEMQIRKYFAGSKPVVEWLAVQQMFHPITKPYWFTEEFLERAISLLDDPFPWLIWTEHKAVGELLDEKYGIPYFSQLGRDEDGNSITKFKGDIAVCSIAAISEGFNLQRYATNLVLSSPKLGRTWEQMLGRTHRTGQLNPVKVVFPYSTKTQKKCFTQAQKDAKYIEGTIKQSQKLNIANLERM